MLKKQVKKVTEKAQSGLSRGLGLSVLRAGGQFINDTLRSFFSIPKTEQKETFAQAVSRMRLTEADLRRQVSRYWQQFGIFIFFSLCALAYAVYLLLHDALASSLVTLLACVLFLAYALRAHFWIFQIQQRKLGCTWQEWWNNKVAASQESKIRKVSE